MDVVVYYRRLKSRTRGYFLDLEDQKSSVERFVNEHNARIVATFLEIEGNERPKLAKAIAKCRRHDCPLLIASNYRMDKNVKFLLALREVPFLVANDPKIDSHSLPFYLNQARDWAARMSESVRKGIQGKVCGSARPGHWNKDNEHLRQEAIKKATKATVAARQERARAAYAPLIPMMKRMRTKEHLSFSEIAAKLNEDGFMTTVGGQFTPQAVHRIMRDFG